MIYIKLKNWWFFFFEVYFEGPKIYTNQLNDICKGAVLELQYLQLYQRCAFLQILLKIFVQICSAVTGKEIFEILQTSVSQKTF